MGLYPCLIIILVEYKIAAEVGHRSILILHVLGEGGSKIVARISPFSESSETL